MNIEEAIKILHQAEQQHEEAIEEEGLARAETTRCLNNLNQAQKQFDSVVADIRQNTKGGDWKNKTHHTAQKESKAALVHMSECEKTTKSLHRIMQKPGIWFGDYCIRPFDDDQFVIEHKSGEAMVLDKSELTPKIEELWRLF